MLGRLEALSAAKQSPERLQAAVVLLARGDPARVEWAATIDWRDAFVWSGLGSNWEQRVDEEFGPPVQHVSVVEEPAKRRSNVEEKRTEEWFVANVRELPWQENELGASCEFDKDRTPFEELGINLTVLRPGQPMTMYHRERYQEGFLVLRGECLLIVEGREVPLRQWDYFHCPKDVAHAIVGAGEAPSLLLAVGSRVGPDVILYPRDETALRHGAGVEVETPHPKEAYARFTRPAPQVPFRDEFLKG